MFRKSLDRFSGMLFVYDHEQEVNFWMRNTIIPLDLLFFDSKGVLKNAHRNAITFDLTNIYGGNSIQYVLEINAGMFDKLGIKPNSEIRYPLIDQELAIWKC